MNGVLVVDKPGGMTSHDVVARVRRLLGTRRVGHAGTLDPMATGVLVVLVGEATKLGPYLTSEDKRYLARVSFGRATDTLDAEGRTTASAEVPGWLREGLAAGGSFPRLAEALAAEIARTEQVPPAFSAIHVGGRRSHELARAGEEVDLAPRPVRVHAIDVAASGVSEEPWVLLNVHAAKGYYVRSLARDLGERLGVPAHLGELRRVLSGTFDIEGAVGLDSGALAASLIPVAEAAARALPLGHLTEQGTERARQGKRLGDDDFTAVPPVADASAWLDPRGRLVAVGARRAPVPGEGAEIVIHRGFAP